MSDISAKIKHVVVLMLENRSFDNMLGGLYPGRNDYDGLTGNETNPLYGSADIKVWNSPDTDNAAMSIPDPDPGELWPDINMQLFGLNAAPGNQMPPMNGFVNNYVRQTAQAAASYSPESVMHYYTSDQVPVISQLAMQFAVSDQWFASAPCQTWPNRFFLHTGAAGGYQNNSPTHFPYLMNTIFNRFNEADWKIYFHDFPQTLTLSSLWPHLDNFRFFDDFLTDAANGKLPAYTFIEPRYFPDIELPNDQHPPHNVGMGEKLIADVYNAVRNAPTWEHTLLIVIYDEHGGIYDHAPPPMAVAPDDSHPQPFGFDRFGVRVPAVLISPYIKAGTILRAAPDGKLPHDAPPYPFDHTSVIATLRKCFNLGSPLTRRDAAAPTVEAALNLDAPRQDCPAAVTARDYAITPAEIEAARHASLNDFQKALHDAAARLPPLGMPNAAAKSLFDRIEDHVENMVNGIHNEIPNNKTPAQALPYIQSQLRQFLGKP